jgi:hypothetical protein
MEIGLCKRIFEEDPTETPPSAVPILSKPNGVNHKLNIICLYATQSIAII